jgi:hypothetical protein
MHDAPHRVERRLHRALSDPARIVHDIIARNEDAALLLPRHFFSCMK